MSRITSVTAITGVGLSSHLHQWGQGYEFNKTTTRLLYAGTTWYNSRRILRARGSWVILTCSITSLYCLQWHISLSVDITFTEFLIIYKSGMSKKAKGISSMSLVKLNLIHNYENHAGVIYKSLYDVNFTNVSRCWYTHVQKCMGSLYEANKYRRVRYLLWAY